MSESTEEIKQALGQVKSEFANQTITQRVGCFSTLLLIIGITLFVGAHIQTIETFQLQDYGVATRSFIVYFLGFITAILTITAFWFLKVFVNDIRKRGEVPRNKQSILSLALMLMGTIAGGCIGLRHGINRIPFGILLGFIAASYFTFIFHGLVWHFIARTIVLFVEPFLTILMFAGGYFAGIYVQKTDILNQIEMPSPFPFLICAALGAITILIFNKLCFRPILYKMFNIIRYTNDNIIPSKRRMVKITENGKWGYLYKINKKIGQVAVPIKYDKVFDFRGEHVKVALHGKYGYVDGYGSESTAIKYDDIGSYSADYALTKVKLDGKWGFICDEDEFNEETIPCQYDDVGIVAYGIKSSEIDNYLTKYEFAKVKLNNKWGLFDTDGKSIVPIEYDDIVKFSKKLIKISLDDKHGCIDTKGEIVIPMEYDNIEYFLYERKEKDNHGYSLYRYEFAKVTKNNKIGLIDQRGEIIIPVENEYADTFSKMLSKLKLKEGTLLGRNV